MPALHADIDQRELDAGTVVFALRGAVDRRQALAVQRAIAGAIRGGHTRVVVDLSAAGAVQPGVVAALLHARRRLLAIGGELSVVAARPLSPLLPIVSSVEAAGVVDDAFRASHPAVTSVVAPMRRAVTRWAAGAGASGHPLDDIALGASEALTNAAVHAYRGREPGEMRLTGERAGDDGIRIVVSDDGVGLCPRPDSPGLGLGLSLITRITRHVDIATTPGAGTRVEMEFGPLSGS